VTTSRLRYEADLVLLRSVLVPATTRPAPAAISKPPSGEAASDGKRLTIGTLDALGWDLDGEPANTLRVR
jgi:hypothetical protein